MEKWESLVSGYPADPTVQSLGKALLTASVVLKEDLAPFEIEWIVQTLLFKPVSLLNVISHKSSDEAWAKPLGDSFNMLAEIVDVHTSYIEEHLEDLVELCQAPYDPQTRKHALNCLASIVRRSAVGAKDARRHVIALQEMTTCRAPTALLVGAICEHHPEVVTDEAINIWRIYLNLLDSNKNTETVVQAVLHGILGLFKHFGCELPTAELIIFYHQLCREFIMKTKCEKVCHRILEEHTDLFKEQMAIDKSLRDYLWATLADWRVADVLRAVYGAVATVVTGADREAIILELIPRTKSRRSMEQLTALRALTLMSPRAWRGDLDVYRLEARLRSGEGARGLAYCIEANAPNCDKLIQTVVMFYDKLPACDRRVVTLSLLTAPVDLRNTAILFLTVESCRDATSLDKFLPIWKDLFNSDNGRNNVVIEKCQLVFEVFMNYLVTTLEGFMTDWGQDVPLPDKIQSLLTLATHVLTLQSPEEYTRVCCSQAYELMVRMNDGSYGPLLAAVRAVMLHLQGHDFGELYESIQIDRCRDEQVLCECCLLLTQAPDGCGDVDDILQAMQIIFSRNDVEARILSSALRKLEAMLHRGDCHLGQPSIGQITQLIEKLRTKMDVTDKDGRILMKDLAMFVGKYSMTNDVNNSNKMADVTAIAQLGDSLVLNIPNASEATNYKINLRGILHAAIDKGEPNALQTLLVIACANLPAKPCVRVALPSLCRALCAAHVANAALSVADLPRAFLLAGLHQPLLEYISQEKSPGVRRMLSDALEGLLMKEPGSEANDLMVKSVGDQALVMLAGDQSTTRRAGLSVAESLIVSMRVNNVMTVTYLPSLLALIAGTHEVSSDTAFDNASTLFMERIELFDSVVIDKVVTDLINTLITSKRIDITRNAHVYRKITKSVLLFVKKVFDYKKYKIDTLVMILIDIFNIHVDVASFYVLAVAKIIFLLSDDKCRDILTSKQFLVLNIFFRKNVSKDHVFEYQAVLMFQQEYAVLLLELQYQKSLQYLAELISALQPKTLKYILKNLSNCLSTYKGILKSYPQLILNGLEKLSEAIPLKEITDCIEKDIYLTDHRCSMNGFKLALSAFDADLSFLTAVKVHTKTWPRAILHLFSRGDDLKSKMSYLTDVLTVAVKFMTLIDVKQLILEGSGLKGVSNAMIGVQFCRVFMEVFYDYLVGQRILLDGDMVPACVLLNDVAKFCIRRNWQVEDCRAILELTEELWPTYAKHTTFAQKYSLMADLACLTDKLAASSAPYQWVCSVVTSRESVGAVCLLPGGEAFSTVYRAFAGGMASRLSELADEQQSFRAILEALATTGDRTLLDIVASLANGDPSPGWWDQGIDACMGSLAMRSDLDTLLALFSRCWEGLALGACGRMMVPLLRYSTQSLCVDFFAHKQTELLSVLRKVQREVGANYAYHKSVTDYIRALSILQVAFEKISAPKLESTSSPLYKGKGEQTWYLVRETCKLCVTLRDKVYFPEGAGDELRRDLRIFHCAAYNCLAAAIVARRPAETFYAKIFDPRVWETLVDDRPLELPLRARWLTSPRLTTQRDVSDTTSTADSLRSRLFLRTLSENPLMYDLSEVHEDEDTPDLLPLPPTTIMIHECNATLYTCLCHVTTLAHTTWLDTIATTLAGPWSVRVKWLIAQALVNCKVELKTHAPVLRPALLAMLAATGEGDSGRETLNGLHMDVIETLSLWREDVDLPPASRDHLNTSIKYLITTILENRMRISIYKSLIEDLGRLLDVYGEHVKIGWDVFERYLEGPHPALKECLTVLKRITKHNICVENLLPILITKYDKHLPQSADVFGKSLAVCDPSTRRDMVVKYRAVLEKVRQRSVGEYVRMLYHAQMGYSGVCDEKNLRHTINLVHKLDSERGKCLQIISSYMAHTQSHEFVEVFDSLEVCELITGDTAAEAMGLVAKAASRMGDQLRRRCVMLVGGYCDHSVVKVRNAAFDVIAEVFEDLFTADRQSSPKRQKTATSPILKTFGTRDPYIITILHGIALGVVGGSDAFRGRIQKVLSQDMSLRFAECFYLTIYQLSIHTVKCHDVASCLSFLLEMLLSVVRSQDSFKGFKLRDEPLAFEQPDGPIKMLTMSRTYQGSFSSRRSAPTRRHRPETNAGIDVQVTIDCILDTFMQFAKTSQQAAQCLFIELMKNLVLEDKVDMKTTLSPLLADVMRARPGDLTPVIVEACRVLVGSVSQVNGFESSVARLKDLTSPTEGGGLTRLLHEEVLLRTRGSEHLVLGSGEDRMCDVNMEANTFSMEGLRSAFGKLSNWDQLTLQQKSLIERDLPTLWTSAHAWDTVVGSCRLSDRDGWFEKMVAALKGGCERDSIIWLRETERWPRRHFEASAVIEAIQYRNNEKESLWCSIQESDCLAEWAARLMVRSARLSKIDSGPKDLMLSHSHELTWTTCANERGLPSCALDCIKRNTLDLYVTETLGWLEQKVLALRLIGLKRNDSLMIRKALDTAEKFTPQFADKSPTEVVMGMKKLMLQLYCDLKVLSATKLSTVMDEVSLILNGRDSVTGKTLKNLTCIYEMAIIHYDEEWTLLEEPEKQNDILKSMCGVLSDVTRHNIPYNVYLSVIFNRMDELRGGVDEDTARSLLSTIQQIWTTFDQFSIDELKRHLPSLGGVASEFSVTMKLLQDNVRTTELYRQRLQLISDAGHTLLGYCAELREALKSNDAVKWKTVFDLMKLRIFENPYAGSDYQLLNKYKSSLYGIYDFDSDTAQKNTTLMAMIEELRVRPALKCLRLSQLCPTLAQAGVVRDECLRHLLALRPGVTVVRIDEKIEVFTDSIRRPCVFRVVLSDGGSGRYLVKGGEALRRDGAAHRAGGALPGGGGRGAAGYHVTPLGEDSGLIEYLEGYERLRAFLPTRNIDGEGGLVSHQDYRQLCRAVPAHALRSAIEGACVTVEDFIVKKLAFQESLCSITIITWLFGLGDRHLQNILYNKDTGALCCVDWGAIFQYGVAELPPARLTRTMLAVCDVQGLESRLQSLVGALRQSHKLHMHSIHEAFKWMGGDFLDKEPYIQSLLQGTALPHEVTKDAIGKSTLRDKEKYIDLLNNVFYRYEKKDSYSVHEQVSNLLQHCTDTRILSATRPGWEPWL